MPPYKGIAMPAPARNPLYTSTTDAQLTDLYRAAEVRHVVLYKDLDASSASGVVAAEMALDDNASELFRLDDELCARGLPLPYA